MNNKLPAPSDNNKKNQLVQSIEKEQDCLSLRKTLAKEHGLTSIGEFIEGRAIVHKDNKRRIMNEQGEYMRDPSIKNLTYEKVDTSPPACIGFSYKEGNMNGNRDFIEREEDNTDIIQSNCRIFSAKDGIIIVVDSRDYGESRLYNVDGTRISPPEGWELYLYAITDTQGAYSINDDFSSLRNTVKSDINSSIFDRRKIIVGGMIAVNLSGKFRMDTYYKRLGEIQQLYNLSFTCSYNLMNSKGELLKTELGEYYANNKRGFDGKNGLLPCIHGGLSDSTTWHNERLNREETRPVFYAVDLHGKVFRDEFNNIVISDDPRWINSFDKEGYAPIVMDKKISGIPLGGDHPHPYSEYSAYICFINKEGVYRKDNNTQKVTIIPFYKTIYDGGDVSDPDIRGYKLFPELGIIEVRQLSITELGYTGENKEIYKYFDYHGNQVHKKDFLTKNNHEKWVDTIDRGDTKARIYRVLSEDLTIYGYETQIDHESQRGGLNSYGGDAKIINRKIQFKNVKFPDGKDWFNYDFNHDFKHFGKSYIFKGCHVDRRMRETFECVKINGLIARYNQDEEGRELQNIDLVIPSVDNKYLFIQRKFGEEYYILNQQFQYIKDKHGNKISSINFPPFYVDGIFLIYDPDDGKLSFWESLQQDVKIKKAYFEDGTEVGEDLSTLATMDNLKKITNQQIIKRLS